MNASMAEAAEQIMEASPILGLLATLLPLLLFVILPAILVPVLIVSGKKRRRRQAIAEGRMLLCPSCGKLISTSAPACPHCGAVLYQTPKV